MLIFKEKTRYVDPLNIIFLCGNKYTPESGKDKRFILKEFLSSSTINNQSIILEEHFVFAKQKKGYLAYDNIFLKNLVEVEKLASLYADKIIIIHETISTAAEIGMLAGEPSLTSKICILVPDDISIEEKKLSYFIELAFFNWQDELSCKPKRITYYPDIEVHRSSINKSEYHTFFHENKIGEKLGNQIIEFVNKPETQKEIILKKAPYNKPITSNSTLSYIVEGEKKQITCFIHTDALKIQLLSMFTVKEFRANFRKGLPIKDHVTYLESNYKKILLNTICHKEGLDAAEYSLQTELINVESCNLRQSVGYFLYMLQAIGLIRLDQVSDNLDQNIRKITISENMNSCISSFKNYIHAISKTAFGGMM